MLTFSFYFYCNFPLTVIAKGVTKYETGVFYSQGFEGFGWGRTNNDGYINTFDYHDNDLIKILVMGSSHMEATQVGINYTTASVLNKLYGGGVYNTGISGHNFLICARNIKSFVEKYRPAKYVVVEGGSLKKYSEAELNDAIKNITLPERTDIIWKIHHILSKSFLSKNSFLRLMHRQINNYFSKSKVENTENKDLNSPDLLTKLLIKMRNAANSSGAKLIIAYHPGIAINDDGSMKIVQDEKIIAQFAELCEKNNIYFVNTGERFMSEYKKDFTLPYGFWNTSVGKGHMNSDGHRMFAEEIFNVIQKIENNK